MERDLNGRPMLRCPWCKELKDHIGPSKLASREEGAVVYRLICDRCAVELFFITDQEAEARRIARVASQSIANA